VIVDFIILITYDVSGTLNVAAVVRARHLLDIIYRFLYMAAVVLRRHINVCVDRFAQTKNMILRKWYFSYFNVEECDDGRGRC